MTWPMMIPSVAVPRDAVRGIYGRGRRLAERMLFFNPMGLVDLYALNHADELVLSDMARTPDAQVVAKRTRAGSVTPDRSGHVRLISIDVEVDDTIRRMRLRGRHAKRELDEIMASHDFRCHRRDHRRGREDWHYDWIPQAVWARLYRGEHSAKPARERWLSELYGDSESLTRREVQQALRQMRLYRGAVDGKIGPLTEVAVEMFQRAFFLRPDGVPGRLTQRMLSVVTLRYTDGHEERF